MIQGEHHHITVLACLVDFGKFPDIVPVIQKTISLQEVTDVRKAKTAAIFPNAIEIVAGTRRVRELSLSKFLVCIHY
jgi:hypothetical protein